MGKDPTENCNKQNIILSNKFEKYVRPLESVLYLKTFQDSNGGEGIAQW